MHSERQRHHIQYQDDSQKNTAKVYPTNVQDFPDYISDNQSFEQLAEELAIAGELVTEAYTHPQIRSIMQELSEKLPYNAEHSHDMAMIAGLLAIHYQFPIKAQRVITAAGLLHDVGKLVIHGPDWERVNWTEEEQVNNQPLLPLHPPASAARARDIDPAFVTPIELHHAFQKKNPYPDLIAYRREHKMEDVSVARLLALADQTEAFITRHRRVGKSVTDETVFACLSSHTYEMEEGRTIRSFSEDEITIAIQAYHLLNAQKTSQSA
jgi:hypothetical protein